MRMHFYSLHAIDTHDVIAKWTLEHRTHLTRVQREHHSLELGNHRTAPVPAEVAASWFRTGIHRFTLGNLFEISASSDLEKKCIRLCFRGLFLIGSRLWSYDHLTKRDRCRLLLEYVLVLLEGFLDFRIAHVFLARRFLKVRKNPLLKRSAIELSVQVPSIFVRSPEPRPLELRFELIFSLELVSHSLDL